jgi:hypothetical protein
MKFDWMDCGSGYSRCTSKEPVTVKVFDFGGGMHDARLTDMGYVVPRGGRFMAYVYGSVHPDAPGKFFKTIEDAKAYVEEQALVGITLNKLTR